jgi:hypothetical protein
MAGVFALWVGRCDGTSIEIKGQEVGAAPLIVDRMNFHPGLLQLGSFCLYRPQS